MVFPDHTHLLLFMVILTVPREQIALSSFDLIHSPTVSDCRNTYQIILYKARPKYFENVYVNL